jgi:predicted nucleotidyltransferase component of viral defense system
MAIFDKWAWIKRNWTYIIEEACQLDLIFVGGTALNLVIFSEYRASEDIDLYDTKAESINDALVTQNKQLL